MTWSSHRQDPDVGWHPRERTLADRAVDAFRAAAGSPRPRPNPHHVRVTQIAAQILEAAAPAARPAVPAAPPDYVPKAHPIRQRRRPR